MNSVGTIRVLRGIVVAVQFDEDLPEIHEIITVNNDTQTPLLVDSLEDADTAICLNIAADKTLQKNMTVARTGRSLEIPVGEALIGRVVDALGRPIDGKDPIEASGSRSVFAVADKSVSLTQVLPEILETGIKVLDFFTPFVKGRKIGIIGGAGVGKTILTTEMINNVATSSGTLSMFAGIGERIREGHELYETLKQSGLLDNTCMLFGQMNENPVQRALVAASAVTLAEYFRDEEKRDILFFADNMYRYVQAKNEVSTIIDQTPSEGGYQPTIFSDIKSLQDRLATNEFGSITALQTIYVPADDLSDPAVQMISHELDSIIVLSRSVAEQGIRPAVDLTRTSSSLLTPEVVGERHYMLSVRVQAILQKYETLKNLVAIIGESELSAEDREDYSKARRLINYFSQDFIVMEKITGIPGERFTREATLNGIEEILI
jgi:F-type H+/Na+-transporting ATPase subunit beta